MAKQYWVPLDQVQGNITPGLRKDHQALLFLRFPRKAFMTAPADAADAGPQPPPPALTNVRKWLDAVRPSIASAESVATFNRLYRQVKQRMKDTGLDPKKDLNDPKRAVKRFARSTWINVAFTAQGLSCLLGYEPWGPRQPHRERLKAFAAGMCTRELWTGDSADDIAAFTVRDRERAHWNGLTVARPRNEKAQVAHALVIVGADDDTALRAEVKLQKALARKYGLTALPGGELRGKTLGGGKEHFGFTDTLSQPDPDDPLAGWIADGEQTVAPGELIRGCDPEPEHQDEVEVPAWERYGSYLVFRKLEQDVELFWHQAERYARTVSSAADVVNAAARASAARAAFATLPNGAVVGATAHGGAATPTIVGVERIIGVAAPAGAPADAGPSPEATFVAARMMGRWKSGAKLTQAIVPDADAPPDPDREDEAPPSASVLDQSDFANDPLGAHCPLFAHSRRANPRAVVNWIESKDLRLHRMVRRGIPYEEPARGGAPHRKGLFFLAYQARIEEGYEYVQHNWLNNPQFGIPKDDATSPPPGIDALSVVADRAGQLTMLVSSGRGGTADTYVQYPQRRTVTARGGGYFFQPSIPVLELLACGSPLLRG